MTCDEAAKAKSDQLHVPIHVKPRPSDGVFFGASSPVFIMGRASLRARREVGGYGGGYGYSVTANIVSAVGYDVAVRSKYSAKVDKLRAVSSR